MKFAERPTRDELKGLEAIGRELVNGATNEDLTRERFGSERERSYTCPGCDGEGREWCPMGERQHVCSICSGTGRLFARVKSNDPDERIPF